MGVEHPTTVVVTITPIIQFKSTNCISYHISIQDFEYTKFYLWDAAKEDITAYMYQVFDIIESVYVLNIAYKYMLYVVNDIIAGVDFISCICFP